MLPDHYSELLTAFVDGEVSPREHEAALRLLQKSAEARKLLEELQDNARRVKALPVRTLGPDFCREVLQRVEETPPIARPRMAKPAPPTWLGVAVAAAVLLAVTGVSYWFFSPPQQREVAVAPKEDRSPLVVSIIKGTVNRYGESGIRVPVADLGQEKTQTRLANELKKQNAVQLELACKDSAQALDGLNTELKKSGVTVLVDTAVEMNPKKGSSVVMVYAENLRAEELTEILTRLGAREKMKDILNRQFASLHVDKLSPEYRDRVARRFGMDSKQLQPPPRGILDKFIEAPKLADRKKPGTDSNPPAERRDKFALVFVNDGQDRVVSPQLQRFLQSHRRQPGIPGTLQIVLVVRPENA
jgi:hypothetical protein